MKRGRKKRKINKMRGGGLIVNIFYVLRFLEWGCDIFRGVAKFSGGEGEKFSGGLRNFGGGVKNFRGAEKFFGGESRHFFGDVLRNFWGV